jgi:hypothetical protein
MSKQQKKNPKPEKRYFTKTTGYRTDRLLSKKDKKSGELESEEAFRSRMVELGYPDLEKVEIHKMPESNVYHPGPADNCLNCAQKPKSDHVRQKRDKSKDSEPAENKDVTPTPDMSQDVDPDLSNDEGSQSKPAPLPLDKEIAEAKIEADVVNDKIDDAAEKKAKSKRNAKGQFVRSRR